MPVWSQWKATSSALIGLGIPTTFVRSRVSAFSTEAYGPDPRGGEPDYQLWEQRPADSTLLAGCLEQHVAQFAWAPERVAADPGFFSVVNESRDEQSGVRRISIAPATTTNVLPASNARRQRWFKELQKSALARISGGSPPPCHCRFPSFAVDAAIEIIETMDRLAVEVDGITNRSGTVINTLIERVHKATAQAEAASVESGKVARKLNQLTVWTVIAAIASAVAACIQAWAAWYTDTHNPHP
jgi:hypothetical protein